MPEECVESLAGVGNPFSLGEIGSGEKVVGVGRGSITWSPARWWEQREAWSVWI